MKEGELSERLGGKLAESFAIQMFSKTKQGFTVGFLTALEPWARAFQVSETRTMEWREKLYYLRAGIERDIYQRPARPVIDPFSETAQKDLIRWAVRHTEKILEKARAKS